MRAMERPQLLIMIKGYPGAGKTTLALELARRMKCTLLCKDDVRDEAVKLETQDGVATGISTNSMSYEIMWRIAERQIEIGLSAIVESPLGRKELYERGVAIAHRHGAVPVVIECYLEPEVWKQRLDARRRDQEEGLDVNHKPTDVNEITTYYAKDAFETDPRRSLRLDTGRDLNALVDEAMAWMESIRTVLWGEG